MICHVIHDFILLQKLSHNIQDYSHNGTTPEVKVADDYTSQLFLQCGDDLFLPTESNPLTKITHWLITELDTVSTLPQLSVAATKRKSFKEIDGQLQNIRKKYLYFTMMMRSSKQMCVLQTI